MNKAHLFFFFSYFQEKLSEPSQRMKEVEEEQEADEEDASEEEAESKEETHKDSTLRQRPVGPSLATDKS